jgi:hypothetical protein
LERHACDYRHRSKPQGKPIQFLWGDWLKIGLWLVGLALACLAVMTSFAGLSFRFSSFERTRWRLNASLHPPRRTLLGREVAAMGRFFWGLGYAIYFSAKLWGVAEVQTTKARPLALASLLPAIFALFIQILNRRLIDHQIWRAYPV